MALVLVLFLILALYIKPVIGMIEAWHQNGAEQQALAELKAERAELESRAAALKLPDAGEVRARELGMVKAGEQAYVVKPAKSGD
ncbi:septum formation initiator family protein [Thermoleophilia bacterium SCSIO 60948]|nr:septum formation initiator family protein [Thermoleophilia bacterium SCSIO 60948]